MGFTQKYVSCLESRVFYAVMSSCVLMEFYQQIVAGVSEIIVNVFPEKSQSKQINLRSLVGQFEVALQQPQANIWQEIDKGRIFRVNVLECAVEIATALKQPQKKRIYQLIRLEELCGHWTVAGFSKHHVRLLSILIPNNFT